MSLVPLQNSKTFSYFKTLGSPSGVDCCISCHFTSANDENLIIVKNNVLEIYKLPIYNYDDSKHQFRTHYHNNKLILINKFTLFGSIQDIAAARFVPNFQDSLLISFPDCRLSIIHFNNIINTIETISIFNFDAPYHRTGNVTSNHDIKIKVDPLSRCASLQTSKDTLFILPLYLDYLKLHNKRTQKHNKNKNKNGNKSHRNNGVIANTIIVPYQHNFNIPRQQYIDNQLNSNNSGNNNNKNSSIAGIVPLLPVNMAMRRNGYDNDGLSDTDQIIGDNPLGIDRRLYVRMNGRGGIMADFSD